VSIDHLETAAREPLPGGALTAMPQAALETQIATFFAEIFQVDNVHPDEDFFDLGGDSLLGESLAASISQFTGHAFEIATLVARSTPREIASYLRMQAPEPPPTDKPPIFMVHGLRGFILPRPEFLEGLAPGQRIVFFELPGLRGDRKPYNSVEEIAADYVRQLEAEYPSGPVLLGGYCGGCIITLEMAAQLADKGRPVLHMVLFDPGGIPRNVLDNFLRRFAHKQGQPEDRETGFRLLRRQLKCLRHFLLLGRWTDGSLDEDLADGRLRSFRQRRILFNMWYQGLRGVKGEREISDIRSREARAKMFAAFQHYKPRVFKGQVTVYCSEELSHYFDSDRAIWVHLLPDRNVHVLGETHNDVVQARAKTGATLMQKVYDEALAMRQGS